MATKLGTVIADFSTQLATTIDVAGTSVTLQSATDDDGIALPDGVYFFTFDGNNSSKEHVVCDLVSTSLTNIKTISRQGVQTSGVNIKHRVGASVSITNYAHIKYINDLLDGTRGLDSSNPLAYDGTPTFTYGQNELVTWDKSKDYTDSVAIAGAAKATEVVYGIAKLSLAAVDPLIPIVIGDNDTRVPTQDENDALTGSSGTPTTENPFITQNDTTNGATITGTTIGFIALGAGTITDSGNGFVTAEFQAGQSITVSGSASNDGTYTIASVAAGLMQMESGSGIVDEVAGATVTIAAVTADKLIRPKASGQIDDIYIGLTTAGDTTYSDGADLQRLAIGQTGQVKRVSATGVAPEWSNPSFLIDTTEVTLENSTTETTVFSETIPGNLLGTNRGVKILFNIGEFDFNNTNTFTIKTTYGSTAMVTAAETSVANISNMTGAIEVYVLANAATNSQISTTRLKTSSDGAGTTSGSRASISGTGTATEDSTGDLNLTVTIKFSAAASGGKIVINSAIASII